MPKAWTVSACALAIWIAGGSFAIWTFSAPEAVMDAPPERFSVGRAKRHLEFLAQASRWVGTEHHARSRQYLLDELRALGLDPKLERGVGTRWGLWDGTFNAAVVGNVWARIRGTASSGAIVLSTHYDSVASGPGAGDDASGVASALETARALLAGPPPKNDVILLFTDGEELGLIGADALEKQLHVLEDAQVVLNFEARGTQGPAMMFETSPDNAWLIRHLDRTDARPFANSLAYEIYRRMPNDTDFTILRKLVPAGLNFAFIEGLAWYHTPFDDLRHLDLRSVQHVGDQMLALTRSLGEVDLRDRPAGQASYFNFGPELVRYPQDLGLLLWVLVSLGTLVLLWQRLRSGKARGGRVVLASLAGLGAAVVAAITNELFLRAFKALLPSVGSLPAGEPHDPALYAWFFSLVPAAIAAVAVFRAAKKSTSDELALGGLCTGLLLATLTTLFVPGAAPMFLWPSALALIAFLASREAPFRLLWVSLLGTAVLILWLPVVSAAYVALTLRVAFGLAIPVALLVAQWLPLALSDREALRRAAFVPGGLCVLALVAAVSANGLSGERPPLSNRAYVLDPDSKAAFWVTTDPSRYAIDDFGPGAVEGPLRKFLPHVSIPLVSKPATPVEITPPELRVDSDQNTPEGRRLQLIASSPRGGTLLEVRIEPRSAVREVQVLGEHLDAAMLGASSSEVLSIRRWGSRESLPLTVLIAPDVPFKMHVVDLTLGVPSQSLDEMPKYRPNATRGPWGFTLPESTILVREIQL